MNAYFINLASLPGGTPKGEEDKEKKMNTQTESQLKETLKIDNPMQERSFDQIAESVELPAEVAFAARRQETRDEAGTAFVP